jgi:hypothetical protein
MDAVSQTQPLPVLAPEDQALLSRYFSLNEDLAKLAAEPGQPDVLSLLRWLSRPEIAAYISAFHAHQNHHHRQSIIAALRTALTSLADPIEVRRAAATLLRAINPPRPPRSDTPPRNPSARTHPASSRSAAPDTPNHRRPTSPTPANSPARPATPSLPAPVPAPLFASPAHTPPNHSSALAQALAILGLPTDLEALDRADEEEDDAEIDAFGDGEYAGEDFAEDLTNPPDSTDSS